VFINLETDPRILHSSPCRTCVNLPSSSNSIWTSAHVRTRMLLRPHSHPRSDAPQTPTHIRAWTLLGLLLTTPLGALCLSATTNSQNSTWTSTWASAQTSVSQFVLQVRAHAFRPHSDLCPRYSHIYRSEPSNSTRMSAWASTRTSMSHFILQVRARTFGPRLDLHPRPCYNPNPCHPTPLGGPLGHLLGHPCLAP
jgi:hypothetical protein